MKNKWINIKDHLPEDLEMVLVYIDPNAKHIRAGDIRTMMFHDDQKVFVAESSSTHFSRDVTHWMELPDPPEDDLPDFHDPKIFMRELILHNTTGVPTSGADIWNRCGQPNETALFNKTILDLFKDGKIRNKMIDLYIGGVKSKTQVRGYYK